MFQLAKPQLTLLQTAAQRADGALFPLAEGVRASGGINRTVAALVRAGLVEHGDATSGSAQAHITPAGRAALLSASNHGSPGPEDACSTTTPPPAKSDRKTKSANVLALLRRARGASLSELTAATGWLPHTARAALSGLRKKGHSIERTRDGDQTRYRIAG